MKLLYFIMLFCCIESWANGISITTGSMNSTLTINSIQQEKAKTLSIILKAGDWLFPLTIDDILLEKGNSSFDLSIIYEKESRNFSILIKEREWKNQKVVNVSGLGQQVFMPMKKQWIFTCPLPKTTSYSEKIENKTKGYGTCLVTDGLLYICINKTKELIPIEQSFSSSSSDLKEPDAIKYFSNNSIFLSINDKKIIPQLLFETKDPNIRVPLNQKEYSPAFIHGISSHQVLFDPQKIAQWFYQEKDWKSVGQVPLFWKEYFLFSNGILINSNTTFSKSSKYYGKLQSISNNKPREILWLLIPTERPSQGVIDVKSYKYSLHDTVWIKTEIKLDGPQFIYNHLDVNSKVRGNGIIQMPQNAPSFCIFSQERVINQ